jgi:hypothetical protein
VNETKKILLLKALDMESEQEKEKKFFFIIIFSCKGKKAVGGRSC